MGLWTPEFEAVEFGKVSAKPGEATCAEGLRDIGKCMSAFKVEHTGQMDFDKASGMVKNILGG